MLCLLQAEITHGCLILSLGVIVGNFCSRGGIDVAMSLKDKKEFPQGDVLGHKSF